MSTTCRTTHPATTIDSVVVLMPEAVAVPAIVIDVVIVAVVVNIAIITSKPLVLITSSRNVCRRSECV